MHNSHGGMGDTVVDEYRRRRAKRLGVEERYDAVDEYHKRRSVRMDNFIGMVSAVLADNGYDNVAEMPIDERIKKYNELMGKDGEKGSKKSGKKSGKKSAPKGSNKKSTARNHECDGSKYKGKPGEVVAGKEGNLKPRHDSAKRIDTKDAIGEMEKYKETGGKKGREKNSLSDFIDANGKLSPERQKVHDEIVQDYFRDKVKFDGRPTMIMSGGGPASGKSFIKKGALREYGGDATIVVDPDEIKEKLPGYTDMAIKTDDAAAHYHEESSALAKRIYQYACDNGINVVYDGTGDGSVNSVMKKIQTARDEGYAVVGRYVTVDVDGPNGALVRNQKRYWSDKAKFDNGESDVPPRLPKEDHVREIHAAVTDIVPQVAHLYDTFELWDNNGKEGDPRQLIATCEYGGEIKLEKGQESNMKRFYAKGNNYKNNANGQNNKR